MTTQIMPKTWIKRFYNDLGSLLEPNRVLVIYGPRRVGKTSLLNNFLATTKLKYKLDFGDNIRTQEILGSQDFKRIIEYVAGYELLVLDEAQQIPNIGMGLKIIVDQVPGVMVIATGSSSFDLAQQVGEPLTGRKKTVTLYPIAAQELLSQQNKYGLKENLEELMVFGSYPAVLTATDEKKKKELLKEIIDSYLLKDILALEQVKAPRILLDLLKLLAFQIGNQVSLTELATQLQINAKTVARYLDLLEKSFVIKRLDGFRRNLRQEVTAKSKYYFYDTGIRNAVISQFNDIGNRNDVGQLFENYVLMERTKKCAYQEIWTNQYFWRTYDQQEIDLIEEGGGQLHGYEFKWGGKEKRAPRSWTETYSHSHYQIINRDNYLDFIV